MDRRLIWLAIGAFATSTVAFVFAGLLPLIADGVGTTVPKAGLLMTAFSLSYAIGTPILATVTGSVDRRRVIAFALAFFIAANLFAATAASYGALMAAQIVMGAFTGLYASTAQSTAIALSDPAHRARAVSAVLAGTTFAVAFGAPLGALIGDLVGWRFTFLFIGVIAVICLAILWFRLPGDIEGVRLSLGERILAVARPGVFPALAVTFLYLAAGFTLIAYLAPLAIDGVGLPKTAVSLLLLVFGLGAVAGNAVSGRLADRLGPTRVVAIALSGGVVLALAIGLVAEFVPGSLAGPVLIALMFPWGVIGWTFPPAQASRLVALAPELAHLTMPLNVSAMYFGIAAGSVIGGRVLAVAPVPWLGFVASAILVVTIFVLTWRRKPARPLSMA
jgi:DHA1 family inner membrane transport protein